MFLKKEFWIICNEFENRPVVSRRKDYVILILSLPCFVTDAKFLERGRYFRFVLREIIVYVFTNMKITSELIAFKKIAEEVGLEIHECRKNPKNVFLVFRSNHVNEKSHDVVQTLAIPNFRIHYLNCKNRRLSVNFQNYVGRHAVFDPKWTYEYLKTMFYRFEEGP